MKPISLEELRLVSDRGRKKGTGELSIRVLIADDEQSIREVLSDLIHREPGLELVGTAGDADEAVDLARKTKPDVALLDVRMPKGGGPGAAKGIRIASPETSLIAFSAHDDASSVLAMLDGGVQTYVAKDSPPDQLIEAIRRGAGEGTWR